jgi:hypothetical protein
MAFFFIYYLLASLVFNFFPQEKKIGRAFREADDHKPASISQSLDGKARQDIRQVQVTLEKYALGISKQFPLWRRRGYIEVVKPLSVSFEPGKLSVIMFVIFFYRL